VLIGSIGRLLVNSSFWVCLGIWWVGWCVVLFVLFMLIFVIGVLVGEELCCGLILVDYKDGIISGVFVVDGKLLRF